MSGTIGKALRELAQKRLTQNQFVEHVTECVEKLERSVLFTTPILSKEEVQSSAFTFGESNAES